MRCWIGGQGNWSDIAHWSDSSGGLGGFTVPSTTDDVFFDSLSNNATYAVSLNVDSVCQNLDIRNPSTGTINLKQTTLGSKMLTIYGSIYTQTGVSLAGITGSQTNGLILRGAGTRNLTTNGVQFPSFSFYGGAGLSCQDAFSHRTTNPHTVLMFNGQWYSNGFTQTLGAFQTSGSLANIADFTNSIVNNAKEWINQGSNITMVTTGSTINCNGRWYSGSLGGIKSSYNVVGLYPSSGVTSAPSIDGGTFNTLLIQGYHWGQLNTPVGLLGDIIVNNSFIPKGSTALSRLYLASNTQGTSRTITCNGTITATNVDMMDIVGAGTANWDLSAISGGSGDALGNSGIVFTTGVDLYYRSTATTCYWSQNLWYNAPTGGSLINRSPLPQDNPHLVANSFSGTGKRLYLDRNRLGNNIDWENVAYNPNIVSNVEVGWYGDIKLGTVNWTGTFTMYLYCRTSAIIKCNGNAFPYSMNVLSIGGTIGLADDFFIKPTGLFFGVRTGTFVSNGYTMDCPYYAFSLRSGAVGLTLMSDVSNSILKVRGSTTNLWTAPTGLQATFDFTNTTIELLNTIAGTFAAGTNLIYNDFKISSSANVTFTWTTLLTINKFIFAPLGNMQLILPNNATLKYNDMFGGGQPRRTLEIKAASSFQTKLDKQTAGIVTLNYTKFTYVNSLDANTIYAVNSVNGGNNTNIIFGEVAGRNKTADFFELL